MEQDDSSSSDKGEGNALFVLDTKGDASILEDVNGNKKRKLGTTLIQKDEEEERLEKLIFGDDKFLDNFGRDSDEDNKDKKATSSIEFMKPAWQDEDDETLAVDVAAVGRLRKLRKSQEEKVVSGAEYAQRLRGQFEKLSKQSSDWAKLETEEEANEAAVLRSTASLIQKRTGRLPPSTLEVIRMKDANQKEYSEAVIQSVKFHPNGQLLLTAGFDKKLRLFQVDGVNNNKMQSIFFQDMPIRNAAFTADGSEIVLTGRRPFFYVYDVVAGKVNKIDQVIGRKEKSLESSYLSPDNKFIGVIGNDGYIVLLSQQTKQWVANFKMNGNARSLAFSRDGNYIYSSGSEGHIYQWDLRNNKCVKRFVDEGSLLTCALASSHDGKYLASGSESGVVNVYDMFKLAESPTMNPLPIKSLMHITTKINHLEFNSDSQILAMTSNETRDTVKLVHVPSWTVFANWPTNRTPLGYCSTMSFSPNSGFLALGNDKGKVLLYRLNHYERV